jgi:O-antigen ligase
MKPTASSLSPSIAAMARPADAGRPTLGLLYVWCTPVVASMATFPDLTIAGMLYTGWMWVLLLLIGVALLAVELVFHRETRIHFRWGPWAVWVGYLWLSLAWCETLDRRNLQDALQTSMPVLLGVLGSVFVRREEHLRGLLRAFAITLVPLAVVVLMPHLVKSLATEAFLSNRSAGLLAALIAAVLIAGYPPRLLPAMLGWAACGVLIAITGSRMAGLAAMLVVAVHPWYTNRWQRFGAMLLPVVCMVVVFNSPAFQERSFYGGSGSLSDLADGDVNTSGRFEVWPSIWEAAWKQPVLGHGIGSASAFVASVWPDMAHPHNDYLRVGFELGLVGLALLVSVAGWQMIDLYRKMRGTEGVLRQGLIASFLGLAVLMIVAATDNALVYNLLVTDPLFVLIGATYGTLGQRPGVAR